MMALSIEPCSNTIFIDNVHAMKTVYNKTE